LDSYGRADGFLLFTLNQSIPFSDHEGLLEIAADKACNITSLTSNAAIFLSLIPSSQSTPPNQNVPASLSEEIHARFRNNNFMVHSHLDPPFAHGAFPLASRMLNHSCVPNSVPKFILDEAKAPRMDVVALGYINSGDEVGLSR
jgi:hypothetical protein